MEDQGRVPLDNFRDKAQAFGLASAAILPYNKYAVRLGNDGSRFRIR